MNNYDTTEASWRTDLEASQLLKQAGFNEPTHAFYNPSYKETDNSLLYPFEGGNIDCWNKENHLFSAPLIPIVLLWLEGLGYERAIYDHSCMNYYHKDRLFNCIDMNDINEFSEYQRQQDLAYIKACCNHIINQQNERKG